jgi:hypothetical protein
LNADGYSTFLSLNNLISAEGRPHWSSILAIGDREKTEVDRILLSAWVCGMTAYFASVPALRSRPFRERSHPPMTVRLRCALEHARQWADHNRPHLRDWLPERFSTLHRATIMAVCSAAELAAWLDEVEQMKSPAGLKYNHDLDVALDELKARLTPNRTSQGSASG